MRFTARRISVLAAALSLAGAMLVGAGGAALATTARTDAARSGGPDVPAVYFQIVSQNSVKCLDVSGASTADGAQVFQWKCLGPSQTNQKWRLIDTGDDVTYYVRAQHSGKCLDVSGASTADGATLIQWPCLGYGQANQRWHIDYLGGNSYSLRPAHDPTKCLDVFNADFGDGAAVVQWSCHFQPNQRWIFVSI